MHKIDLSTTNPKTLEIAQTISMLSTDQSCNRKQLIYPILCLLILLQLGNKVVGMLLECILQLAL